MTGLRKRKLDQLDEDSSSLCSSSSLSSGHHSRSCSPSSSVCLAWDSDEEGPWDQTPLTDRDACGPQKAARESPLPGRLPHPVFLPENETVSLRLCFPPCPLPGLSDVHRRGTGPHLPRRAWRTEGRLLPRLQFRLSGAAAAPSCRALLAVPELGGKACYFPGWHDSDATLTEKAREQCLSTAFAWPVPH